MYKSKRWEKIAFGAGILIVLLSFLPYLILGTDSIVPYYDQLDGEVLSYLFRAKYLFQGGGVIPEFLSGAAKTSLTPPAPLAVLLFNVFSPFWAYLILQFAGQITAYIGMYLAAKRITKEPLIAVACALLFAFLPFRPVYGLTQFGMPLLIWSVYNLYKKEYQAISLACIALYTALSSLVLAGFGILLVWAVFLVILVFRKKLKDHGLLIAGFLLMFIIYILENAGLLIQVMGGSGDFISHKADYVISASSFFSYVLNSFLYNSQHSEDYHLGILIACVITLIAGLVKRKNAKAGEKRKYERIAWFMGFLFVLYLISGIWRCEPVVAIRSQMGSLGTFQLERLLWMTPAVWYLLLACVLDYWLDRGIQKKVRFVSFICLGLLYLATGLIILKNSLVKPVVQKVLNPSYPAISWSDYYADGVMEQVEEFIAAKTNMVQQEYRVVSLGIDPAASLYHGFYTVDGYSNNYSLDYKNRFRQVIAPELDKSPYLEDYYDNWGNRCYLFSSEAPGYFTIEKGTFWYQDLQIDTAALSELSCRYILSAAYIVNSEELGLVLLREEPFETDTSYYQVFLYEVSK